MNTSPASSLHPQALTVEALAAALRPVAAMWFTKGEVLALEALIQLASQGEFATNEVAALSRVVDEYAELLRDSEAARLPSPR